MTPRARTWHLRHPMPKNPTLDQRLVWHRAHQRACGCRPIPPRLLFAVAEKAGVRHPVVDPRPRGPGLARARSRHAR